MKLLNNIVTIGIETAMQVFRCHAPMRWEPDISIEVEAHLETALAAGRGAILWDSHFYFASLITKMGIGSIEAADVPWLHHHLAAANMGFH